MYGGAKWYVLEGRFPLQSADSPGIDVTREVPRPLINRGMHVWYIASSLRWSSLASAGKARTPTVEHTLTRERLEVVFCLRPLVRSSGKAENVPLRYSQHRILNSQQVRYPGSRHGIWTNEVIHSAAEQSARRHRRLGGSQHLHASLHPALLRPGLVPVCHQSRIHDAPNRANTLAGVPVASRMRIGKSGLCSFSTGYVEEMNCLQSVQSKHGQTRPNVRSVRSDIDWPRTWSQRTPRPSGSTES